MSSEDESDIMTKTRRNELLISLYSSKNENVVLIQTRLKRKQSRSLRGSQFRGVSKNGKKWQVSIKTNASVLTNSLGPTFREPEETLHRLHYLRGACSPYLRQPRHPHSRPTRKNQLRLYEGPS